MLSRITVRRKFQIRLLEGSRPPMMIAEAEKLKKELTDKYVVVNQSVAELRRFAGLTGKVKTVNMNCRALVEFDGPVDISWYDIDPSFLTVVDAPQPKEKKKAEAKSEKPKAAPAKPAADEGGKKLSPLEMARQQGAAGKAPAGDSGKKLSPLEMARQQGAAGKAAAPAADSGKKLSPLELARQQGAAKAAAAEVPAAPVAEPEQEEPVVEAASEEPEVSSRGASATPGTTAEIIALARQQGPFKG